MDRITVSIDLAAPIDQVWAHLADLEHQHAWMGDIESLSFETAQRGGAGTIMLVATKVGPLRLADRMEVIAWEPPTSMTVAHLGLVKGTGEFQLAAIGGATRLTWTEKLDFPWQLGGFFTAVASRPILATIWRHNLKRLKGLVER